MDWLTDPQIWIAFLTLTSLEVVLGIDNVIFISILSSRLGPDERDKARRLGLLGAMLMRIALLFSIKWVMGLDEEAWFTLFGKAFTGKDVILFVGGAFLIAKSTHEIHAKVEGDGHAQDSGKAAPSLRAVIFQVMLLDIVFSLDSVITAVGMADQLGVMIAAVVVAVALMMVFAKSIGEFVERHPTVKMLALAFLILIGTTLVIEGWGGHVEKGYIYFAMGFSVVVEMLNLRMQKNQSRQLDAAA